MKSVINIDDGQVFTADFVFQQMMAQSRRIDRAEMIAKTALLVAMASMVAAIITLLLRS